MRRARFYPLRTKKLAASRSFPIEWGDETLLGAAKLGDMVERRSRAILQ